MKRLLPTNLEKLGATAVADQRDGTFTDHSHFEGYSVRLPIVSKLFILEQVRYRIRARRPLKDTS